MPSELETVTINIPVTQTILQNEENVYAYVYLIHQSSEEDQVVDIALKKQKGYFVGSLQIPSQTLAIYTNLSTENQIDNNGGYGWTSFIYKDKKPLPTASLHLNRAMVNNADYWNGNGFHKDMINQLIKDYSTYQHNYSDRDLMIFYKLYQQLKTTTKKEFELKILSRIYQNNAYFTEELPELFQYFFDLGDFKTAAAIEEKLNKDKPWSVVKDETIQHFLELPQLDQKLKYFEEQLNTPYKNKAQHDEVIQELAFFSAMDLVEAKQIVPAMKHVKYFTDLAYTNLLYSTITNAITSKEYTITERDNEIIGLITQVGKDSLLFKRYKFYNYFQHQRAIAYTIESRNRNRSKILVKQNQPDKAIQILKEIEQRNQFDYFYYGQYYYELLVSEEKYKDALELWARMQSSNYTHPKIESSIEKLIDEKIYDFSIVNQLKNEILLAKAKRTEQDIRNKLSNTTAPDFKMKDYDGKEYRLSDFKGKTVFIDFWATWCAICISSFEELNTLQEHFKDADSSVQFIFVQTLETAKQEDAIEAGKKILKNKQVNFLVLYDDENKYANQYQIKSLPTKIYIDKNGNFRYKSVGYTKGYDNNLIYLTTVFKLMNQ